jgi:hypothetical protein
VNTFTGFKQERDGRFGVYVLNRPIAHFEKIEEADETVAFLNMVFDRYVAERDARIAELERELANCKELAEIEEEALNAALRAIRKWSRRAGELDGILSGIEMECSFRSDTVSRDVSNKIRKALGKGE